MNQEALTPSQAGEAIRHALRQVAAQPGSGGHLEEFDIRSFYIERVLHPAMMEEDFQYALVDIIQTDQPKPIMTYPVEEEVRAAVASVLNPELMGTPRIDASRLGITDTYTRFTTNVQGILLLSVNTHDHQAHAMKTYWRIQKETFWDE